MQTHLTFLSSLGAAARLLPTLHDWAGIPSPAQSL